MRKLLYKIIRYSGLPILFREVLQKRKVTILMFHDIKKSAAEQSFSYLSKHYNIIPLDFFLKAKKLNEPNLIPDKALVITFDDGHKGNYELLPLLKKYNIPITIFLCAGIINNNRHFWFTVKHPNCSTSELKKVKNQEKLRRLKEVDFFPEKEFDETQVLTKNQIQEMKPFVNFQSHTVFHPCLPQCDDAEAKTEITDSKTILEKDFDLKINAIAYPNGDHSNRDVEFVNEAGYEAGLTVIPGFNTISSDHLRLRRISVNDTENMDELIAKSSGVWGIFKSRIFKTK